jgi:signal transduction histidine kinase
MFRNLSMRTRLAAVLGFAATFVLATGLLIAAELHIVLLIGVAVPIYGLAVAVAAWVLIGAVLNPVRHMTREARAVTLAQPGRRLPQPPGDDELAELGRTLNLMLDRIESTAIHERAFVDDASHELRTPIAVLRAELELALLEIDDHDAVVRNLASALEEADRLTRLTEALLVLARSDAGQLGERTERVDVFGAAQSVLDRYDAGIEMKVELVGAPTPITADRALVEQIVANLVDNALRHADHHVLVDVRATGDAVVLTVADDGPGFANDIRLRAFDRFTRSGRQRDRRAGGTGLGLAIVAAVAGAFGGRADARNGPPLGGGAVSVRFPRAPEAAIIVA